MLEKLNSALDSAIRHAEERLRTLQALRQGVYIVFDGPPGPQAPGFVEVEDAQGRSRSVGEWSQRSDGLWTLGPFYAVGGTSSASS